MIQPDWLDVIRNKLFISNYSEAFAVNYPRIRHFTFLGNVKSIKDGPGARHLSSECELPAQDCLVHLHSTKANRRAIFALRHLNSTHPEARDFASGIKGSATAQRKAHLRHIKMVAPAVPEYVFYNIHLQRPTREALHVLHQPWPLARHSAIRLKLQLELSRGLGNRS